MDRIIVDVQTGETTIVSLSDDEISEVMERANEPPSIQDQIALLKSKFTETVQMGVILGNQNDINLTKSLYEQIMELKSQL